MSSKCSLEVSRLIAEVRTRPELWDREHPQHHNRSALDHHWESVAAALGIVGKAARSKWKNLKDHFRKEFKRSMEIDQEMSRWPYFHSMMFIKDQISHTALNNTLYLSADLQHQSIYPEVELKEEFSDGEDPLNCLNVEYENQNAAEVTSANHDENISDDKHFLLSLLPMFCTLPMDKKLKARIAIETLLLNIAYPELSTEQDSSHTGQNDALQKPSSTTRKRKRTSEDELHAAKCFV